MKILKQLSKIILKITLILFFYNYSFANEPIDIWKIEKKEIINKDNFEEEGDCDLYDLDPDWEMRMSSLAGEVGIGVEPVNAETLYYSEYVEDWFEIEDSAVSMGWYWSELEGSSFAPAGYVADPLGLTYLLQKKH